MNSYSTMFLLMFLSTVALAQLREREEEQKSSSKAQQNISAPVQSVIMDGPVDPKEYIVGPGDIFNVSIWSATPLNFQVPVTPEGSVVIPTVNEIAVSGLTLEEAKKSVLSEIKKKYLSGLASFTLMQPRSFVVNVSGVVFVEGPVIVQAHQRVDGLFSSIFNLKMLSEQNVEENLDLYSKKKYSSRRKIKITRKNGEVRIADIEKYFATLNTSYNPLLMDGDMIVVPPNNLNKDFIGVYGAVSKSATFEFVKGDSLSTIIAIAGGLSSYADPTITISRSESDGKQSTFSVNIEDIYSKKRNDIVMQSGDRVFVQRKNSLNYGGSVEIEGEVYLPGAYPIVKDSTSLREIIRRAGGLTESASLNTASIIRKNIIAEPEREYVVSQLKRGYTAAEDTAYFTNEILLKYAKDVTSVDFVSLFEKNDASKDVILQDGDKIIIPSKTNVVYVFGDVKAPGYIRYAKGKDWKYYVTSAGGSNETAELDDVKIVKGGSKQWLAPSETSIEEGDFVWVPKEPYRTTVYYLGIYSQIFGIVGTVATLILLVTR